MKRMSFEDSIFSGRPGWSEAVISPYFSKEELEDEKFLTETITELWSTRQHYSTEIKGERQCIRGLDQKLSQTLYQMKSMLSKPGRNGGWSSWLAERGISRATADRLSNRFAKSRGLDKLLHEAIQDEPTESEIGTLFAAVWPRLERKLTTPSSRFQFLRCVIHRSGLTYDWQDNGIMTFEPGHEPVPAPTDHDGGTTRHGLGDGYEDVL